MDTYDVAVVGAGAAGLMAAIQARRARPEAGVIALDGAARLGAKILVAGGGRCNVTHHAVSERDFAGSTPAAIRRVLRRFTVADTVAFFAARGVTLKREETGKLFPTTDRAQTVLAALLAEAREGGVTLRFPWRVSAVDREGDAFVLRSAAGDALVARAVVLASGGRSLPKSGSDGAGYAIARALGLTATTRVFPALVPLTLPAGDPLTALAGLATDVRLEVIAGGTRRAAAEGAALLTHFGLSGPAVLDISRHWIDARADDPAAELRVRWLPVTEEAMDARLRGLGAASVGRVVGEHVPERLARALCERAGVDPATPGHRLTREARRALVRTLLAMPLPVTGDRGWNTAEVTAGGVPLAELDLHTLEARRCPGLFLCGEICDVDGRIGGFNFQWAWASGYVAGLGAAAAAASAQAAPSVSSTALTAEPSGRKRSS